MLCDPCLDIICGKGNLTEDQIKDFIKFKKFK